MIRERCSWRGCEEEALVEHLQFGHDLCQGHDNLLKARMFEHASEFADREIGEHRELIARNLKVRAEAARHEAAKHHDAAQLLTVLAHDVEGRRV